MLQAMFSGSRCVCLVSNSSQLMPYAALSLERDGANNFASSRLEFWTLDARVEKTPWSVSDSTKCPHKYRHIE